MYKITFSEKAAGTIRKLPLEEGDRIMEKIELLQENPFRYLKRLQGNMLWSLRVSKRRVIIDVIVSERRVFVIRVGKRDFVYDS